MPEQTYGCNYCKVIFTVQVQNTPNDKTEVKCPYCGGAYAQILNSTDDVVSFVRSIVCSSG